jgi:hypothetical protein
VYYWCSRFTRKATMNSRWLKEACLWRLLHSPLFQFPVLSNVAKKGAKKAAAEVSEAMKAMKA